MVYQELTASLNLKVNRIKLLKKIVEYNRQQDKYSPTSAILLPRVLHHQEEILCLQSHSEA